MSQQSHQGRQSPPSERELGLIEASEARADLYDTLGQLRVLGGIHAPGRHKVRPLHGGPAPLSGTSPRSDRPRELRRSL